MRCKMVGLVRAVSVGALAALAGTAAGQVEFKAGRAEMPTLASAPAKAAALRDASVGGAKDAPPGAPSRVVVRFTAPITEHDKDVLGRSGLTLLSPLGSNAFFASVAPGARLDAIGAVTNLAAASAIRPEWKQHPVLLAGTTPTWAVVEESRKGDPTIGAYVLFHADAEMGLKAAQVVARHSGVVRQELLNVKGLVIELPLSEAAALASEPDVMWLEPALPQMGANNDSNRARTQADLLQTAPYNLDGTGVTVLIYDAGTARSTHQTFGGRLTTIDSTSVQLHSTHVAGTVGGSGAGEAGNIHKGMAPGVLMLSAGLETSGGIFLYTNPGDLESDYGNAINGHGADIANNSIGTNTETNGFDCAIQGDYGVTDTVIDAITRGTAWAPFRIVWAAGNERQGHRCDVEGFGQYYSSAPPAGAKNHITVGALNSNDDSMTSFSSWGPTDDGRMKPDVSGPGCQSNGDSGVTSSTSTSDTSYGSLCGTSMAAPTVCGVSALIMQDYRAQFPALPEMRNSTLKVLLAHTAIDLGNTGPDYQFGYGSVRAKDAVDFMRTGSFLERDVVQGETFVSTLNVPAGSGPIKVTIAWDDVPGTPNVNPALVNDIDVRLVAPGGQVFLPWTLDPLNPSAPAVQTAPNHRDNIEQVFVQSPAAGTWRVEVTGFNVPQGPQPVSIGATPALNYFSVTAGQRPALVAPGTTSSFDVSVRASGETLVPGTALLFYRTTPGGAFQSVPLVSLGGTTYRADLPGAFCDQVLEYYVSAQGSASGVMTSPPGAPSAFFSTQIGGFVNTFFDNFETNQGWTVTNSPTLTAGAWNRDIPRGGGDRGDPASDADGSGRCFLTDSADGDTDVDGGATTLTSPTMDGTGNGATLHYWRWYSNSGGADPNNDVFRVDISNNNGANWQSLETVGPAGPGTGGGWFHKDWVIGSVITPTTQMKVRFIAEDAGSGSLIEAGVDGVVIDHFVCDQVSPACPADWNHDGTVNSTDVSDFINDWFADQANGTLVTDFNHDGVSNSTDVSDFINGWFEAVGGGCP
jgi:hypothetical protein